MARHAIENERMKLVAGKFLRMCRPGIGAEMGSEALRFPYCPFRWHPTQVAIPIPSRSSRTVLVGECPLAIW